MSTLPTDVDAAYSNVVANRILMRKNLENLRDRIGSKYFKNIVIRDVPWGSNFKMPKNFPQKFLNKYPYDYQAEFTVKGCNMLKCYKHDYFEPCRENGINRPRLINGYAYACNEACFRVYEEFSEFLTEKFKLLHVKRDLNDGTDELFFETLSVGNGESCFCGVQLSELKKLALFPSSRWRDDEADLSTEEYLVRYGNDPTKLRDMAGLVDSPPLTWDASRQNVKFNAAYCHRFRKEYSVSGDECYEMFHRTALGFVLGENVIKQFSDHDMLSSVTGMIGLPHNFIADMVMSGGGGVGGGEWGGLDLNPGYSERVVSREDVESALFVDEPDMITGQGDGVETINTDTIPYSLDTAVNVGTRLESELTASLAAEMATGIAIEVALTRSPAVAAKLLTYYSQKFLQRALTDAQAIMIPFATRFSSLCIRSVIADLCVSVAVRALTSTSTALSGVFAVGLLTLIPDILLGVFNVGGYNNELSRSDFDRQREAMVNAVLKSMVENDVGHTSMAYLVVHGNRFDGGSRRRYVSPLITPEFVYSLGLVNFLQRNTGEKITIGHDGIDPNDQFDLSCEYLECLEINSVGQYVDYREIVSNDGNDNNVNSVNKSIKNERVMIDEFIFTNKDIYLLTLGLVLIGFTILFWLINYRVLCVVTALGSSCCFSIWFNIFKPAINSTHCKG